MKTNILRWLLSFFAIAFPFAASAAIPAYVLNMIGKINTQILNPIIAIMFALATVYFIWGVVQYIWNPESDEAREKGRSVMIYGIIGMTIMMSVFAIMKFVISSIGADPAVMNYV
ncbi:MAG TPA: hypothetical protein VLB83_05585 [Candidatus Paceibacterota bacterium]|nr:hypothetical protein [Candidatus Paceibacterota bacterium]